MSKVMSVKRCVWGFLFAPLVVIFWMIVVMLVQGERSLLDPRLLILVPITWCVEVVIGIPVALSLRYLRILSGWTLAISGGGAGSLLNGVSRVAQGYPWHEAFTIGKSLWGFWIGASVACFVWLVSRVKRGEQ